MDCLVATRIRDQSTRWSWFGQAHPRSLAERTSSRYLLLLFFLIAVSLPFQLYVWIITVESKTVDDLLSNVREASSSLTSVYSKLTTELDARTTADRDNNVWTNDQLAECDNLVSKASSLATDLDRLSYASRIITRVSLTMSVSPVFPSKNLSPNERRCMSGYGSVMSKYQAISLAVVKSQEIAKLAVGIIASFILPILFGSIGATAYIVREISNQIKTSTFSEVSPVRHLMRATLGALSGVVIGLFSNLSNQLSLSPLAIAFLAGYGVESLFSMFDGVVKKFKQP